MSLAPPPSPNAETSRSDVSSVHVRNDTDEMALDQDALVTNVGNLGGGTSGDL